MAGPLHDGGLDQLLTGDRHVRVVNSFSVIAPVEPAATAVPGGRFTSALTLALVGSSAAGTAPDAPLSSEDGRGTGRPGAARDPADVVQD